MVTKSTIIFFALFWFDWQTTHVLNMAIHKKKEMNFWKSECIPVLFECTLQHIVKSSRNNMKEFAYIWILNLTLNYSVYLSGGISFMGFLAFLHFSVFIFIVVPFHWLVDVQLPWSYNVRQLLNIMYYLSLHRCLKNIMTNVLSCTYTASLASTRLRSE